MFIEEIKWLSFPDEMPRSMKKDGMRRVIVKLKGSTNVESAKIGKDGDHPLGVFVQLDSGGVNSGTDVTNQVFLIAFNPCGKKSPKKKDVHDVKTTETKNDQPAK